MGIIPSNQFPKYVYNFKLCRITVQNVCELVLYFDYRTVILRTTCSNIRSELNRFIVFIKTLCHPCHVQNQTETKLHPIWDTHW